RSISRSRLADAQPLDASRTAAHRPHLTGPARRSSPHRTCARPTTTFARPGPGRAPGSSGREHLDGQSLGIEEHHLVVVGPEIIACPWCIELGLDAVRLQVIADERVYAFAAVELDAQVADAGGVATEGRLLVRLRRREEPEARVA